MISVNRQKPVTVPLTVTYIVRRQSQVWSEHSGFLKACQFNRRLDDDSNNGTLMGDLLKFLTRLKESPNMFGHNGLTYKQIALLERNDKNFCVADSRD
jgi:hypothetical protein